MECLVLLNAVLRELSVRICAQQLPSRGKSDGELRRLIRALEFFPQPQIALRGRVFTYGFGADEQLLTPEGDRLSLMYLAMQPCAGKEYRPIVANGVFSRDGSAPPVHPFSFGVDVFQFGIPLCIVILPSYLHSKPECILGPKGPK